MTEIECYVHGLYPRSEALVAATRDADRGRATAADVERQRQADRDAFVTLQQDAGLTHLTSGCFDWQDLFRPFVNACAGISAGPLTRWFDNNTFFRTPVVRMPLGLDVSSLPFDATDVGLLPGPYTFARLASADAEALDVMEVLSKEVLRPAAEEYAKRRAVILHLQEPALVVDDVPDEAWPRLSAAIHNLRDGLAARVVLHTYFGDAGPWLDRLRALPVDAVGVDLSATDVSSLVGSWNTGLLLGCIDGRSSRLEDPDQTAAVVRHVLDLAQPPAVFLSANSDLEFLPRQVADEKVRVLAAVTERVRGRS